MAMKPEPMEFEGEGSHVYPMQMVQNESQVQIEQLAFSLSEDPQFSSGLSLNQGCDPKRGTGKIRPKHNRQHSAVSDILLGTDRRQNGGKFYKNSDLQPFTIARGEIELNSKFLPKKYKCGMCVYKTSYKSDLNRHMRRHSNNKEVPFCRECKITFVSTSALLIHSQVCPFLSVPSGPVQYQCDVCPYTTSYRSELSRHTKCHSTYEFACDICFQPFQMLGMLEQHRRSVHNVDSSGFTDGGSYVRPQTTNPYHQSIANNTEADNAECVGDPDGTKDEDAESSYLVQVGPSAKQIAYGQFKDPTVIEIYDEGLCSDLKSSAVSHERQNIAEEGKSNQETPNKSANESSLDPVVLDKSWPETDRRIFEDSDAVATDSASKSQLQKQSRVRELLSLNSTKQPTLTLSIKQFCCEICKGIYASVKELLQHKKSCVQKDVPDLLRCTLCSFHTCNSLTFKRHKRKHSAAAYSCEGCNQPFMIERNLIKHKPFCKTSGNIQGARVVGGKRFQGLQRGRTHSSDAVLERSHTTPSAAEGTREKIPYPLQTNGNEHAVPRGTKHGEVLSTPPESGRFARLISDFDVFSHKPYACALCFYRTDQTTDLVTHVQNHLTGCNVNPIPETARFRVLHQTVLGPIRPSLSRVPSGSDANEITRRVPTVEEGEQDHTSRGRSLSASVVSARARYQVNPPSLRTKRTGRRCTDTIHRSTTKAFGCRVCGKQFSVRALLTRHLRKIHKNDMETEDGGSRVPKN